MIPRGTAVVFDINIYLSYILGDDGSWPLLPTVPPTTTNPSADAISLAFDGTFALYTSPHILTNIAEKMRAVGQSPAVVDEYLTLIVEMCDFSGGTVVDPATRDLGIADFEDNLILGLAKDPAVDALIVVTNDHDLLDIGPAWNGRLLMPPAQFVRRVVSA